MLLNFNIEISFSYCLKWTLESAIFIMLGLMTWYSRVIIVPSAMRLVLALQKDPFQKQIFYRQHL